MYYTRWLALESLGVLDPVWMGSDGARGRDPVGKHLAASLGKFISKTNTEPVAHGVLQSTA